MTYKIFNNGYQEIRNMFVAMKKLTPKIYLNAGYKLVIHLNDCNILIILVK